MQSCFTGIQDEHRHEDEYNVGEKTNTPDGGLRVGGGKGRGLPLTTMDMEESVCGKQVIIYMLL